MEKRQTRGRQHEITRNRTTKNKKLNPATPKHTVRRLRLLLLLLLILLLLLFLPLLLLSLPLLLELLPPLLLLLIRGDIVNRTYGTHKKLNISKLLQTILGRMSPVLLPFGRYCHRFAQAGWTNETVLPKNDRWTPIPQTERRANRKAGRRDHEFK